MKPLNEIRSDLANIRYYYARKEVFDKAEISIGKNAVADVAKKYNAAIRTAPPRLYDLYISLYIMNNTQESLAAEMNYSLQNIQLHHTNLVLFLQKQITE